MVKNLPANAGDTEDVGWIPGSGRSPGEGNGDLLQYSCPEISWTEEPDGLQSMELQSDMTEHAHVVGTEDLKQKRNMAHAAVLQQLLQCCAFLS